MYVFTGLDIQVGFNDCIQIDAPDIGLGKSLSISCSNFVKLFFEISLRLLATEINSSDL